MGMEIAGAPMDNPSSGNDTVWVLALTIMIFSLFQRLLAGVPAQSAASFLQVVIRPGLFEA